jgi:alpha-tubulin suppressor-like RCC1 family protein
VATIKKVLWEEILASLSIVPFFLLVLAQVSNKQEEMNLSSSYSSVSRFSIFVSQDNQVYSWGRNDRGHLGLNHQKDAYTPQLVTSLPPQTKILHIATGCQHVLFLTTDHKVLVLGLNDHGQLGIGSFQNQWIPVELPWNENSTPIRVVCGGLFSGLITDKGEVYTWGQDDYNQLGHGTGGYGRKTTTPTKVSLPEHVIEFTAGHYHSLVLTKEGNVYGWGENIHGEIGLGHKRSMPTRALNPFLKDVVRIACGSQFSVALTADGKVYTWGCNDSSCLGRNSEPESPVVAAENVHELAAGGDFCIVRLQKGGFLVWGNNQQGQLGSAEERQVPTPIFFSLPDPWSEKSVLSFGCGWYHMFMGLEDGTLLTWGSNNDYQLGHGDGPKKDAPTKVADLLVRSPNPVSTWMMLKWGKIYVWLFLGRVDEASTLRGLPIEIIFHMIGLDF